MRVFIKYSLKSHTMSDQFREKQVQIDPKRNSSVTVCPFYRDQSEYGANQSNWDYEKIIFRFKRNVEAYENANFVLNTCTKTKLNSIKDLRTFRFSSDNLSLMHAIVASEAELIAQSRGQNIILCGSDELFVRNPSSIFDEDFDLLIPFDGISRIMNGMICVRCNERTEEFFKQRLVQFVKLQDDLQSWGGDMQSYMKAFAHYSLTMRLLQTLSFPNRAQGKSSFLQSVIYKIAPKLEVLKHLQRIGGLKVKFFYWGKELCKSVDISCETQHLDKVIDDSRSKGFYMIDFKGSRKQIIG